MLIQCTKALLRELALEPDGIKEPHGYEDMPQALMAWHAGIVELGSDKAVVLMNNATRYSIVLYGAEPLDSGRIKHLIRDAVTETLSAEGISRYHHRQVHGRRWGDRVLEDCRQDAGD